MKEIVKACKGLFNALLIFSIALLFILFSAKDWKRYDDHTTFLTNLMRTPYEPWRARYNAQVTEMQDDKRRAIEQLVDSIFKNARINFPFDPWSGIHTDSGYWPPKERVATYVRFYPEKMTLSDYVLSYDSPIPYLIPNERQLMDPLVQFAAELDSIKKRDGNRTRLLQRKDMLILYMGNPVYVFRIRVDMRRMGSSSLDQFPGYLPLSGPTDTYPGFGEWVDEYVKQEQSLSGMPHPIDSALGALIEEEPILYSYSFAEALAYIKGERDKRQKKVEFLGMEIDFDFIASITPIVYVGFFLTLFFMLGDFTRSLPSGRAKLSNDEYWFLLKNDPVGITSSILSLLFSLGVFLLALVNFWSRQGFWLKSLLVLAFVLSLLLAILDFTRLQRIRRRFSPTIGA